MKLRLFEISLDNIHYMGIGMGLEMINEYGNHFHIVLYVPESDDILSFIAAGPQQHNNAIIGLTMNSTLEFIKRRNSNITYELRS